MGSEAGVARAGSATPTKPSLSVFWAHRHHDSAPPWTRAISHPAGAILAYICCLLGLTPNQVTISSFVVGMAGAILYYLLPCTIAAAIILLAIFQLSYALDCADGQLARATARTSGFGRWLDAAMDFGHTLALPLAMAAFAVIKLDTPSDWPYVVAAFFMAYARVLCLFGSSLRRYSGETMKPDVPLLRQVYRFFEDTGTILTLAVLVRPFPVAVMAMLAGYGVLSFLRAVYLGIAWGHESDRTR